MLSQSFAEPDQGQHCVVSTNNIKKHNLNWSTLLEMVSVYPITLQGSIFLTEAFGNITFIRVLIKLQPNQLMMVRESISPTMINGSQVRLIRLWLRYMPHASASRLCSSCEHHRDKSKCCTCDHLQTIVGFFLRMWVLWCIPSLHTQSTVHATNHRKWKLCKG